MMDAGVGKSKAGLAVKICDLDGVPKKRLCFALNNVLTDAEEAVAREYLSEAGYAVLEGPLPAKASYRNAQNHGRRVTATNLPVHECSRRRAAIAYR